MEVADVMKVLRAHRTNAIGSFIHPIARREDILALRRSLRAEKDLSLHVCGNHRVGKCKHRRSEVDEAHKIFAHRSGLDSRPAHNEWHVDSTVVNPAFAPRQTTP